MLIQEENMQKAINYLLGITEQDVNPAFKGHAKEWMRELRSTWGHVQAHRNYTFSFETHPESCLRTTLEKMLEPANCLASVLSIEARERLLNYLNSPNFK